MSEEYYRCLSVCNAIMEATKQPLDYVQYAFFKNKYGVSTMQRVAQNRKVTHADVHATCTVRQASLRRQSIQVLFCAYIQLKTNSHATCDKQYDLCIMLHQRSMQPEFHFNAFILGHNTLKWLPKEKPRKTCLDTNNQILLVPQFYSTPKCS